MKLFIVTMQTGPDFFKELIWANDIARCGICRRNEIRLQVRQLPPRSLPPRPLTLMEKTPSFLSEFSP